MSKIQNQKISSIDSLSSKRTREIDFDFPLSRFVLKNKKNSVLFSRRNGRAETFFTIDSKLYYTPEEQKILRRGQKVLRVNGRLDSLHSRAFEKSRIYSIGTKDRNYLEIKKRYSSLRNYTVDLINDSVQGVSLSRMWNVSVVGAIIFGMLTMTMIYRYLGQSAVAEEKNKIKTQTQEDVKPKAISEEVSSEFIKILQEEDKNADFEAKIKEMVKGYPIEKMAPYIAKKDKLVAAFLVSIAMQESTWGVHVPLLNGEDCYNYWGYRGIRKKMGTGGHTCFDGPKDAVDTVAKRIEFLIANEKIDTPEKMVVVWKCGYDCSWDTKQAVNNWISSVDQYFKKFNEKEK